MDVKQKAAVAIRVITGLLILFSIAITFYVMIVEKDFEVFTNPDGPDTSDYFEE